MIEIQHLTKKYGEKVAVRELDLRVAAGELFAFLGPNGAGKTTTIKVICGLLLPTAGAVRVGGHDIVRESLAAKAHLGYVPDAPFLYEKLTGREFIHFAGGLYRLPGAEIRRRLAPLAERLELGEFLDLLCEEYSHGMKQRVVLAAALLHGPRVLVVDEPMVGLDPRSIRIVKGIFRELTDRGGTIFMSTHTLSIAEDLADRIGIIDRGRLTACGTLAELQRLRAGPAEGGLEDLFLELTGPTELAAPEPAGSPPP
jgi:ABC-2 type transport system ATP-binding protein